jgi:cytochrome c biogenesis protein CcmG/thiol:disulfide interchange protein DsbE
MTADVPPGAVDDETAAANEARRRRRRQGVLGLIGALAVLVLALVGWALFNNGSPKNTATQNVQHKIVAVAKPAPDFTVPGLWHQGDLVKLSAYRGKPVVLNLWASWCDPCREEFPLLQKIHDAGKAVVIGVSFRDANLDDLQAFARQKKATWVLGYNPNDSVGSQYKAPSDPMTYFIDAQGIVREIYYGELLPKYVPAALARIGASEAVTLPR